MSSDDGMRAIFELAPFIRLVGYRLVAWEEGWVETRLELEDRHLQQHGHVHAGVITTMADHTSGAAASTIVPEGRSVLTAELGMHLLRPARGEALTCQAEIVKGGRRLIVTQADVHCGPVHVARFHATMAVISEAIGG